MNFDDTRMLLGAVERAYTPSTTLVDVFFPNIQVFSTEIVDMEFRKGSRLMAPFVVPGGKGINMARTGSTIRSYRAPLMRPKRIIEPAVVLASQNTAQKHRNSALLKSAAVIYRNLLICASVARNGWPLSCCLTASMT